MPGIASRDLLLVEPHPVLTPSHEPNVGAPCGGLVARTVLRRVEVVVALAVLLVSHVVLLAFAWLLEDLSCAVEVFGRAGCLSRSSPLLAQGSEDVECMVFGLTVASCRLAIPNGPSAGGDGRPLGS